MRRQGQSASGYGYAMIVKNSLYSSSLTTGSRSSGPIWMDEVACTGGEKALSSCKFGGWGVSDCNHWEDVQLQCSNVRLKGGADKMEGRLEVDDPTWNLNIDRQPNPHQIRGLQEQGVGHSLR